MPQRSSVEANDESDRLPAPTAAGRGIAVVGMACTFAGARNVEEFWRNIVNKVDAVTDSPAERLTLPVSLLTNGREVYCKRGGWIGDSFSLNPVKYGIMPSALVGGEPDHFLVLRTVYEALEDAGYDETEVERTRVNVILGKGNYPTPGTGTLVYRRVIAKDLLEILKSLRPDYSEGELQEILRALDGTLPPLSPEVAGGLVSNVCSGRVSNRLDFMGPNFTVDAACASSLISVELGMRDLLSGTADMAVVGGVHVSAEAFIQPVFESMRATSPTSTIRPYDEEADGTVPGEGVGILVLKRLADAERDGDRVYAVILGVGSSSDGRAKGVTAPRVEGQEIALRRAYEASGVSPKTIELLEGHGTGTPVGDAAELEALHRVFGAREHDGPACALGSVKSMIGHAMPAAGAAGLIKTVLALYHRVLPPTINCRKPRAELADGRSPFYINTETRPWLRKLGADRRRAGVSAFGFGGINAHAVLEEYEGGAAYERPVLRDWSCEVVVVEAGSREALRERLVRLREYASSVEGVALSDIAYTCNTSLTDSGERVAVVASSLTDFTRKLDAAALLRGDLESHADGERGGIYYFGGSGLRGGKLALLFPGEGSQYVNMLSDLCLHFPEVRETLELADYVPDNSAGASAAKPLSAILYPPPPFTAQESAEAERRLLAADGAIGSLIAVEYAIVRLLCSLELKPDIVVGHSAGEWAAMMMAGVLEPDEFISKVKTLSGVDRKVGCDSALPSMVMLLVGASREAVTEALRANGRVAHIASDNCPHQVVAVVEAGDERAVVEHLRGCGILVERLPHTSGYHTPAFSALSGPLREFLHSVRVREPRVPLYSCATAEPYPSDPEDIRGLVADMFARPVLFRQTIENLYEAGVRLFVETGPRANLTAFVKDILGRRPHLAVSIDQSQRSGVASLQHALGMLAAMGVHLNFEPLYKQRELRRLSFDVAADSLPDPDKAPGAVQVSTRWPQLRPTFVVRPPVSHSHGGPEFSTPTQADGDGETSSEAFASIQTHTSADVAPPQAISVIEEHFAVLRKLLENESALMLQYLGMGGRARLNDIEEHASTEPTAFASAVSQQHEARQLFTEPQGPQPVTQPTPELQTSQPELDLTEALLRVVNERTGYPLEILDLDLDMEADLGIDSIKRVEIFGALRQLAQGSSDWNEGQADELARAKSLRQILTAIQAAAGVRANGEGGVKTAPLLSTAAIETREQGRAVSLRCSLDASEHVYLSDHCLYFPGSERGLHVSPLPRMPMTGSVELMAEAASLLCPGLHLVEASDIYARRWINVEQQGPPTPLAVDAKKTGANTVRVVVWSEQQQEGRAVVAEGNFVFDTARPDPPAADPLVLQNRRSAGQPGAQLYRERLLFHGPSFQGVSVIEHVGDDGAVARLRVLPRNKLLRSHPEPEFRLDPFLLDAATQVAGYWALQNFSEGATVFPFRMGRVMIYRGQPEPGMEITCQARVTEFNRQQIKVDFDLLEPDGGLLLRVVGWEALRFYVERHLLEFLRFPNKGRHGVDVSLPASAGPDVWCTFIAPLKEKSLWGDTFMRLVLSRREMDELRRVDDEDMRAAMFVERAAAKDAVRMWAKARFGRDLFPADIEVEAEADGRYTVGGTWAEELGARPFVSASRLDEAAVGAVSDHEVAVTIRSVGGGDGAALAASRLLSCGPAEAAERIRRGDETVGVLIFDDGEKRVAVRSITHESYRISVATAGANVAE